MLRILLLTLLAGIPIARASDPITAPAQGASAAVTQPHVTAELIPETTAAQAGQPFDVALHLHADAGWHTYWINPGDAGLATRITWTLPNGFTAGPIQWPTPEKHSMGPLVTYGYGGDVYLLTTITPPKDNLPQHFEIKAKASWLVCQEACIPGKAELTVPMDSGLMNLRLPQDNTELFAQAKARMPVENTRWDVKAAYCTIKHEGQPDRNALHLEIKYRDAKPSDLPVSVQFFPEQPNVLSTQQGDDVTLNPSGSMWEFALQQNGEKPDKLGGVLVSSQPLIAQANAVYFPPFPVSPDHLILETDQFKGITRDTSLPGISPQNSVSSAGDNVVTGPGAGDTTLIAVLGAAFIGGLILNLMPCVLPVLSLKVFSLMKHAGDNAKTAWIQGVAFTAGVVISFWALAGLLLVLRTAGNHLGWGFQMQSPGFVLFLILLFFLLALNLFGVFELGASLVGLDAKTAGKLEGTASSFGNGALATLAATPCTAPFMGSALGYAAQQPAYVSLLIFTFLAVGMAAPYLLLTIFPGALRFVPKPGAWMEAFKQFMGFLLMATVIFLVYVFGALIGEANIINLLFGLLIVSLAAWLYGDRQRSSSRGFASALFVVIILLGGVGICIDTIAQSENSKRSHEKGAATSEDGWQPWTQSAVDAALAKGQPVFVDFTAAWCLSCKVNERVALGTDAVKKAFTDKNVALFVADWTHADPEISQTLQKFNRDGVPLYLVYSPKNPTTPQVLPEVLTPGIVLDAVKNL